VFQERDADHFEKVEDFPVQKTFSSPANSPRAGLRACGLRAWL
jgi:hypothetical protein